MHEPLAVERLGHLLQDLDAQGDVVDQVIVGGEDGGDLDLGGKRWMHNTKFAEACYEEELVA